MSGSTAFPASAIISGVFNPARLGTGTPSAGNFLRGDGSWQTIPTPTKESIGLGNVENAAASALYVALTGDQSISGAKTFTRIIGSSGLGHSIGGVSINYGTVTGVNDLQGSNVRIVGGVQIDNLGSLRFSSSLFGVADIVLARDATGVLAMRNGISPQSLNIYNTYTNASNYERGVFRWTSNTLTIGTEHAGTGVPRGLNILFGQAIRPGRIYTTDPVSGNLILTSQNGVTVERDLNLADCNIKSNESFTVGPINNNTNLTLRRSGSGNIILLSLPTTDPSVIGAVWRSGNDLKISTGP